MSKKERLRKKREELLDKAINETNEEKRRMLFEELSGIINVWKRSDLNEKIEITKKFLEEIKNSHGKINKMIQYGIRFGEFKPILYPDQIITIKKYLEILEKEKDFEPIEIWKIEG